MNNIKVVHHLKDGIILNSLKNKIILIPDTEIANMIDIEKLIKKNQSAYNKEETILK